MIPSPRHFLLAFALLLLGSCCRKKPVPEILTSPNSKDGYTTVLIHGTLAPVIDKLMHTYDILMGLSSAKDPHALLFHGRIARLINNSSPDVYPFDKFYYFGWSGGLSFSSRRQAARDLYFELKKLEPPFVLIGHSHGGNVILELAAVAREMNDSEFVVDKVILLATPAQLATSCFAHDPIFKQIYNIYSACDFFQILDPQRFYYESPCDAPTLSERLQPAGAHIKQARILQGYKNPTHLSFILDRFMRNLPFIIDLMDSTDQDLTIINIPAEGKPFFVERIRCGRQWTYKKVVEECYE